MDQTSFSDMVLVEEASDVFGDRSAASLALAACEGEDTTIRELVASGVPVDSKSDNGETILAYAVRCGNLVGVKTLLEFGANPNAAANDGRNPVVLAARKNNADVLEALLKMGGNPNSRGNSRHETTLQSSIYPGVTREDWSNFDLLVEYGADLQPEGRWETMYETLAGFGAWKKIHELIEAGHPIEPSDTFVGYAMSAGFPGRVTTPYKNKVLEHFMQLGFDVRSEIQSRLGSKPDELPPGLIFLNEYRASQGLSELP